MKKIEMSAALLTGHHLVDAEHQKLIGGINLCVDNLESGSPHACADSLDSLGMLLITHFQNEENIMRKLKYPKLHNHMNHHVSAYNHFFDIDGACSVPACHHEECITEMKSLLLEEIISADMDFKSYLAEVDYRP